MAEMHQFRLRCWFAMGQDLTAGSSFSAKAGVSARHRDIPHWTLVFTRVTRVSSIPLSAGLKFIVHLVVPGNPYYTSVWLDVLCSSGFFLACRAWVLRPLRAFGIPLPRRVQWAAAWHS